LFYFLRRTIMCKRLYFLIFVVLVLGFSSAGWADPIDVNNPSFELGDDGNKVPGHTGFDNVMAWEENADDAVGWVGVDVQCPYADSDHCHRWPGPTETGSGTDVVYTYLQHTGSNAYQVLDTNTSGDPNAVIAAGRRYTLTFDALNGSRVESGNPVTGSLFYPDDVNFPGDNHNELVSETYPVLWIDRPLEDCEGESSLDADDECPDWNYDLTVVYVATSGSVGIGKTLGVKLMSEMLVQGGYAFVDNVRLEWSYATIAYDPNPTDGAELITKNPTLSWTPGVWAATTNGHEVYFGTDETAVGNADNTDTTGIYRGVQSPNSYTPTENPLVLGETYYWKITEVNSAYSGPAAGPPWEGDVWSFRVEGHAYDPSPADMELDVVFLGLDLEWAAGAEAEDHVVYLGTDETAVTNADTTDTTGIYKTTLTVGTENYPVSGQLTAGETYYWRIDEKKTAAPSHLITGDVWSFTAGTFLIIEEYESYTNQTELWDVWDDYWANGSDGEIFLENDVNIIRESGSQAVELKFTNTTASGGKQIGSQFDVQDMTELDIGSNWTIGGVEGLFMYLRGDPCNAQVVPQSKGAPLWEAATPWIELEDTSSNTGYVLHPSPGLMGNAYWNEWNVDLNIFDACGVDLTAIDRFTIGIGGAKAGQSSKMSGAGYIWADDIRLYPPRCRPEVSEQTGDFTGDCNVMYDDLDVMTTDWLMTDGNTPTENRPATLTRFPDATSHWISGYIGTGAIQDVCDIDVTDPRLVGLTSMSITAWVRQPLDNEWAGIVSSREAATTGATVELGLYGGGYGGPGGLGYDWSNVTGDAWKHDAELDVPEDSTWTFVAMAVDPNGCSLYMRPDGGALQTGIRNVLAHPPLAAFNEGFFIGRSNPTGGYLIGAIDDVRIYTYDLDFNDINDLAYQTGDPNPAPVYHYKFDETTGYTAADSGTPTEVYGAVQSVANLTDPEPQLQRSVNFADYVILADNWMSQNYWP
jgi:hypothetical protein